MDKKNMKGLYLILDQQCTDRDILSIAIEAIEAGVDIIQYREKVLSKKDAITIAGRLRELTYKAGVTFIVNDDPSVALAVDADGVHLGQDDVPPDIARKILGNNKIIGISTHSMKEVSDADKADVDYIAFGPVFYSDTKTVTSPYGVEGLRGIRASVHVPLIAIGGINKDNVSDVVKAGADSVAVISAVLAAVDVKKAVRELKKKIEALLTS